MDADRSRLRQSCDELTAILRLLPPVPKDPKTSFLFSPYHNPVISDEELICLGIQFHHLDIETATFHLPLFLASFQGPIFQRFRRSFNKTIPAMKFFKLRMQRQQQTHHTFLKEDFISSRPVLCSLSISFRLREVKISKRNFPIRIAGKTHSIGTAGSMISKFRNSCAGL